MNLSSLCRVWSVLFVALLVLFVALLVSCGKTERKPMPSSASDTVPSTDATPSAASLDAISLQPPQSEFLNTAASVKYVGSEACADCHESEYKAFHDTTHSRALDDIQIANEPHDGEVVHRLSGRNYRIYRQNGELRHREYIPTRDGSELLLADHAMRLVIGSGNHSRSYLVDIDGYFFESPVTWYTAKKAWGMSPGYEDNPVQPGFARPVTHDCIHCHSGRTESDGPIQILENSIGCERCHGAGSLHTEHHSSGQPVPESGDLTIVHPGRLSREKREAICAQCHLSSAVQVEAFGRSGRDFRPGFALSEFRVDYQFDNPESAMTVVGHVEQMRHSRCYQQSATMTCTTCHNPHDHQTPAGQTTDQRRNCLSCHETTSCGLDEPARLQQDPTDNCIACHMPRTETDIPHFAFTHHRIGIHAPDSLRSQPQPSTRSNPGLVPIYSLEKTPAPIRQRNLGLAYLKLADDAAGQASADYRQRGRRLLADVRGRGLRDPEIEVALAWDHRRRGDLRQAIEFARLALSSETIKRTARVDALAAASRSYFDLNQFDRALPLLRELGRLRIDAEDQMLLALSHLRTGNLSGAFESAEKAARLEPDRPDLHELLAELHRQAGNSKMSAQHKERAARLRSSLQAVVGE